MHPRPKIHCVLDSVVLPIVVPVSSCASPAIEDSAIAVKAAVMKRGANSDVKQAVAINDLNPGE